MSSTSRPSPTSTAGSPPAPARSPAGGSSGWTCTERGAALLERSLGGALFLGCDFTDGDDDVVRRAGAIVLPEIPGIPVDTYRSTLYSPGELYDAPRYHDTLDARAYAWSQRGTSAARTPWPTALHDHAVDRPWRRGWPDATWSA